MTAISTVARRPFRTSTCGASAATSLGAAVGSGKEVQVVSTQQVPVLAVQALGEGDSDLGASFVGAGLGHLKSAARAASSVIGLPVGAALDSKVVATQGMSSLAMGLGTLATFTVLCDRDEFQVARVHAGAVSTEMVRDQIGGCWPNQQFIRGAVRSVATSSALTVTHPEKPVSIHVAVACPLPTSKGVGMVPDEPKKALLNRQKSPVVSAWHHPDATTLAIIPSTTGDLV